MVAGGLSELRAELRDFPLAMDGNFNAVREDLNDLRAELRSGFDEVRSKFDLTAAGHQQIVGMLQTLIDREDGVPGTP